MHILHLDHLKFDYLSANYFGFYIKNKQLASGHGGAYISLRTGHVG